jgi:hypothetical protein
MYRLIVQLKEIDCHGNDYGKTIHEILYPEEETIKEAFEALDTGRHMLKAYLEIEKSILESINISKSDYVNNQI